MIKDQLSYSYSPVTDQIKDHFIDVSDFVFIESNLTDLIIIYLETMVDMSFLEEFILTLLKELDKETIASNKLKDIVPGISVNRVGSLPDLQSLRVTARYSHDSCEKYSQKMKFIH